METSHLNTETLIMEAAKRVFLEKGFDGTRMQDIADVAQINKSLLHYYYRSKDKLFEAVFTDAFSKFIPKVIGLLSISLPFKEKMILFVKTYSEMLSDNPFIPSFILHELNRHPERIVNTMKEGGLIHNDMEIPAMFFKQIEEEIKKGNIKPIEPYQLIVNLLALCIFPFVARPMLEGIILNPVNVDFDTFIQERIELIPEMIFNALKP